MREGWEVKKLSDVCTLINGRAYKKQELLDEGKYRVLRVGNLFTNNKWYYSNMELDENKYCDNNDLIYAWSASFGPRIWQGEKVIYHYHIWKVEPNLEYITKMYLFRLFEWDKEQIKSDHGTGTTMMHVGKASMESRLVPIPPLPEQTQIVNTLDIAFKQIDQAKANLEKNLHNAKELFQSKLNEVFSQRGEGWEEKRLGEIASVEYGFTAKSTAEGTFRYVRITDIDTQGNLILDDKKYIEDTEEARKFQLKENDILMARTGATFGKVLLYKDYEPSVFASYLIRIHFTENISNELYWYFSKSQYYWSQANTLSSGSAQPHFNGKALKEVIFSYPKSIEEQKKLIVEFKTLLDEIEKLQTHYQHKLNNLEELKKSILQKAFRGELDYDEL